MITLTLNNFRCWENKSFSFKNNGIILLSGMSGKGKSTILNSILYAITGNVKNVATFGKEKTKLEVVLVIDDLIITRGKNPTRFMVKQGSKMYEENEAQSIIDHQFGTEFKNISYIDQDNTYSFVYLTPETKMSFLRNLLLSNDKIEEMKDSIKLKLDSSKKELISHDSKISVITPLFNSLTYTENFCKIKKVITIENYAETLQTLLNNLDVSKKNRTKLAMKLSKLDSDYKKYMDQKVLSQKRLEIESELALYNISELKETLSFLQSQKNEFDKNQTSIEKQKQHTNDLIEKEKISIEPKDFSLIPTLEKIVNIYQSISNLEDKIGDVDELTTLKSTLMDEIQHMSDQTYECPSCETNLKLEQGKLVKTDACIKVSKEEILKKQKQLEKTQKELTLLEKYNEEYNILFDKFELLVKQTPYDTDTDFGPILSSLKKEERAHSMLVSKIAELDKRIEAYKFETVSEISINIYEIVEKIAICKDSIKRYNDLQERLLCMQFDALMDPSDTLQETKEQIISFEQKIEGYETSVKQLNSWKQIHDTNTKYTELAESIRISKDAKDYLMDEIKCYEKLLYFVKEAETRSIFDFIDSLNQHANMYIEDFFPDEDIRVNLVTNKELKSGKDKTGLFFEVQYHTIKGDLDFLSGGQRDRINLAFTLAFSELVQSRILLLDECISSLDSETSDTVIETLKEKYKGKLILCVAHQVNTGAFDQVVTI